MKRGLSRLARHFGGRMDRAGRLGAEMRTVVLLAFVIIAALGAHFYAYVYPSLVRMLVDESERDAIRAAEVLQLLVLGDTGTPLEVDPAHAPLVESARKALGVARFKIFSADGTLQYASDGRGVGTRNESAAFRDTVARGRPYTYVVGADKRTVEGEASVGDVVESYIPVFQRGHFVGAFEIDYDIGANRADFDRRVRAMNMSVAILLALLLAVFAITVFRSYRVALRVEREHIARLCGEIEQRLAVEEELRASQGHFRYLAHHDALTGLPNRTLFLDRFEHALANARRHTTQLALLFIDLDHFKQINDTYGHETGDRMLRATAQILQRTVRESDTAARIAGDEFAVLVEHADESTVVALIERLSAELNGGLDLPEMALATSASIGVSLYPDDGQDVETLLHHADLAMYAAKTERRGSWRYFSPAGAAACL